MRYLRRGILLAAVLALAACQPVLSDKYPYAPRFVSPAEVPPTVLKPPPKPGSKTYKKEMEMVLANQRVLQPEIIPVLQREDIPYPELVAMPVLGEDFSPENYPITYDLLKRAGSDGWRIGDVAKHYWKSKRPFQADKRVKVHVKPLESAGYPSGHSLNGHLWAYLLADLIPEQRVALYHQADIFANHRVDAGMHFPFDIHAGIKMSHIVYQKIRRLPEFKRARCAAAKEIATHGTLSPIQMQRREVWRHC